MPGEYRVQKPQPPPRASSNRAALSHRPDSKTSNAISATPRKRRSVSLSSGLDIADNPQHVSPPPSVDASPTRSNQIANHKDLHSPQHPAFLRFYAYDIDPCLMPLTKMLPAINPEYFQQIYECTFRPENLSKLSNDFATSCKSVKQEVREGGRARIRNTEDDATIEDLHNLPFLLDCFRSYITILYHITEFRLDRSIANYLRTEMGVYYALLMQFSTFDRFTFESIRTFHITFHKKRLIMAVDGPPGWSERDTQLERQNLR